MEFQDFKAFVLNKQSQDYQTPKYFKTIAERYPFLLPTDYSGKIDKNFDFTYLDGFWKSGWTELFVTYCEKIKPEFDKLLEEHRKKTKSKNTGNPDIEELNTLRNKGLPFITDVKEKYGTARVYWSSGTRVMNEAEFILDLLSSVTCMKCGKTPRTSDGRHLIWQTHGWITNLCRDCFEKDWTNGKPLKKKDRKAFKEYRDECRIDMPKMFCTESWSRDEGRLKKYWKDTNDGWLELDRTLKEGD